MEGRNLLMRYFAWIIWRGGGGERSKEKIIVVTGSTMPNTE